MTEIIPEDEEMSELFNGRFPRVDLVHKSANGVPRFLIAKAADGGLMAPEDVMSLIEKAEASTASMNDRPDSDFAYIEPGGTKDEQGRTTPRSLRHFPIYDAAHVRNALSRAPQSPFGDKAMPKITAAAEKFGVEVAKAAGDEPLLEGTDDGIPGSVAWETVDSDTAMKWSGVLARAKNAVSLLADREAEEGECPFDLEDTCAAIDCAISLLAPYAVGEQAEADRLEESIAKAAENLSISDTLVTIEQLVPVRKAGRVLSSVNEDKIRTAVSSLQEVLMTLPEPIAKAGALLTGSSHEPAGPTGDVTSAPHSEIDKPNDGHEVTPTSETHEVTPGSDVKTLDGLASAQGDLEGMSPTMSSPVEDINKASGDPMMAVYSQSGKLLGAVDPSKITELQDGGDDTKSADDGAAAAAAPTDDSLTPAAPDTTGTPAGAVVAKAAEELIMKAAIEEAVTAALVAKEAEQVSVIKALEDRLAMLEAPAQSRVLANGAVPPAHLLRGMNLPEGAPVQVQKAAELQYALSMEVDVTKRAALEQELNALAITELEAIRANPQPIAS